jgi:hypothetical protein
MIKDGESERGITSLHRTGGRTDRSGTSLQRESLLYVASVMYPRTGEHESFQMQSSGSVCGGLRVEG